MSSMDLFEDGFPHSTPAGYKAGCRGSACPGKKEHGFSCADAFQRFSGDYAYQRWVRNGASPAQIAEFEREVAKRESQKAASVGLHAVVDEVRKHELVGRDGSGELCSCGHRASSLIEHLGGVVTQAAGLQRPEKPVERRLRAVEASPASVPAPVVTLPVVAAVPTASLPKRSAPPVIKHGTSYGYQRGCRVDEDCPKPEGVSCRAAYRAYQRDYSTRRRANQAKLGANKGKPRGSRVVVPGVLAVPADVVELQAEVAQLQEQLARYRRTLRVLLFGGGS